MAFVNPFHQESSEIPFFVPDLFSCLPHKCCWLSLPTQFPPADIFKSFLCQNASSILSFEEQISLPSSAAVLKFPPFVAIYITIAWPSSKWSEKGKAISKKSHLRPLPGAG